MKKVVKIETRYKSLEKTLFSKNANELKKPLDLREVFCVYYTAILLFTILPYYLFEFINFPLFRQTRNIGALIRQQISQEKPRNHRPSE